MMSPDVLERGLEAFARQRWREAFDALTAADAETELAPDLIAQLATAALLVGDESGIDTATRAHEAFLRAGDEAGAARSAVWIAMYLMDAGEAARSGGWVARARRIVEAGGAAEAVGGLVLIPQGLGALYGGESTAAIEMFSRALALGERFDDHDTIALARMGLGQAMITLGDSDAGFTLFDEVMVAVTAGELSPVPSGIAYCEVIGTCQAAFDFGRAREWTIALDRWCSAQPDMVTFSGQCQVYRAALYRLHGGWQDAFDAATSALARARRGDRDAFFGAWYEQGEIQRLRGDADAAEESYRRASEAGYPPQPGLALLRLAQGRSRSAQSLLREAMANVDAVRRRRMLPALVEIELALHDVAAARQAVDELISTTPSAPKPMLQAVIAESAGAVLLAERAAPESLEQLRRAWALWHELDIPYEAARCRMLVAQALRALGDETSASMEFDAARTALAELGAATDLLRLDALARAISNTSFGPLTAREVEVVRLVAAGTTNRAIANELYLSEKTVAHHLSNVFTKLGLASRSALTAYAYQHGLV